MELPYRDKQRITLAVEGLRLPLSVPRSQERAYRLACEELAETTDLYRNRHASSGLSSDKTFLAMAAVDIAYRNQLMLADLETRTLAEELRSINKSVEQFVGEHSLELDALEASLN